MQRWWRRLLAAALLASGLDTVGLAQAFGRPAPSPPCAPDSGEPVTIRAVAEDFGLTLTDGRTLRIAGIDPARSTAIGPSLPDEARRRLADWMAGRSAVMVPLGAADRWNRIPALVFARPPTPAGDGAPALLSAAVAMVDAGLARARPEPESHACWAALLLAEATARAAGLGLWADPYYAVRNADDLSSLGEAMGDMALVQGRVTHVGRSGARLYIDLGPIRGSVALRLASRASFILDQLGLRQDGLVGLAIRARGYMDDRYGPQIDVTDADQIELLGASGP